jgi:hypothetical protein
MPKALFISGLILLVFTFSCSRQNVGAEKFYFHGDCTVSVKAEPEDAYIYLDGIKVGSGLVSVEMPCGEKQIMVKKAGFIPKYFYQSVSQDQPLSLELSLVRSKDAVGPRFALSKDLVAQVERGQPITLPGDDMQELAEGEYPSYMGDMAGLLASVKGSDASADSGAEVLEVGPWESVEDWR